MSSLFPFSRPVAARLITAATLLLLAIAHPLSAQQPASPPSIAISLPSMDDPRPVIRQNSVSAVANQPFTFQIRATNSPTTYSAENLPDGLVLDEQTGLISGTPALAGIYTVMLQASNGVGIGTADLQLAVFIRPPPTVNITVENDATIIDGKATTGSFLITRTGGDASDPVKITYTATGAALGGVDYTALKGAANIRGDKGLKHLKIIPIDHGMTGASTKAVRITLQPGIGYLVGPQIYAKLKVIDGD